MAEVTEAAERWIAFASLALPGKSGPLWIRCASLMEMAVASGSYCGLRSGPPTVSQYYVSLASVELLARHLDGFLVPTRPVELAGNVQHLMRVGSAFSQFAPLGQEGVLPLVPRVVPPLIEGSSAFFPPRGLERRWRAHDLDWSDT